MANRLTAKTVAGPAKGREALGTHSLSGPGLRPGYKNTAKVLDLSASATNSPGV